MNKFLLIAALTLVGAGCSTMSPTTKPDAAQGTQTAAAATTPEQEQKLKQLRADAEAGNPAAQTYLGILHAKGEGGVNKDINATAQWFRKAADQGFAPAQTNLAVLYLTGEGVGRDANEAVRLTRAAADQGYPPAQTQLGFLYGKGTGVPQDFKQAESWLKKAAAQGDEDAKRLLGELKNLSAQQKAAAKKP